MPLSWIIAGAASAAAALTGATQTLDLFRPAGPEARFIAPAALVAPLVDAAAMPELGTAPGALPRSTQPGALAVDEDEIATDFGHWTAVVEPGQTFDGLLNEAGVEPALRAKAASAIGAEFNLTGLGVGQRVGVSQLPDRSALEIALDIPGGHRLIARRTGDGEFALDTVEVETRREAVVRRIVLEGALADTEAAVDLPSELVEQLSMLAPDLLAPAADAPVWPGAELELLWWEQRTEEGYAVGRPELSFARLSLGGVTREIVWPGPNARATAYAAPHGDDDHAEDHPAGQATAATETAVIFHNGTPVGRFLPPVLQSRISSPYGMRVHPVLGTHKMHTGVDFAAPTGTPILASGAGTVTRVGPLGAYGNVVEITHDNGTLSRYAHMNAFAEGLTTGERVEAGALLGEVGSTGRVTGPHLHYELRIADQAVDPLDVTHWFAPEAPAADVTAIAEDAEGGLVLRLPDRQAERLAQSRLTVVRRLTARLLEDTDTGPVQIASTARGM
jgi:hypothetical protein